MMGTQLKKGSRSRPCMRTVLFLVNNTTKHRKHIGSYDAIRNQVIILLDIRLPEPFYCSSLDLGVTYEKGGEVRMQHQRVDTQKTLLTGVVLCNWRNKYEKSDGKTFK